jgi:Protein of unknown function (DUF2934)
MTESVTMSVKTTGKEMKSPKAAKPRAVKPQDATGAKAAKAAKGTKTISLSADDRHQMISERAYLLAEQRGFQGGDAVNDWLAAEAEIDSMFKVKRGRRASSN